MLLPGFLMTKFSAYPFHLVQRKDKNGIYYVRFKATDSAGKTVLLPWKSTGETKEAAAMKKAFQMLEEGITKRAKNAEKPEEKTSIKTLSLINSVKTELSKDDYSMLLEELKAKGIIKTYTLSGAKNDIEFCRYLLDFWNYESSDYLKECKRHDRQLTVCHIQKSYRHILKYWVPFFKDRQITDITKQDLRNFLNKIDELPLAWGTKKQIYGAGQKALKYAYNNEILEKDITAGIMSFSGKSKERVILTKEQVRAVFAVEWIDERMKLANLLALMTGLRLGEIRALQKGDLGENCIYVRHSWNEQEGLKCTKNRENRAVYCPHVMTSLLLAFAERNPLGAQMDSFVFFGDFNPTRPVCSDYFIRGLKDALLKIGMSKEQAKEIKFHAWRHLYSSLMADRLPFRILQTQTGHKTLAMAEHYANHILDSDSKQIQDAQNYLFSEYLGIANIDVNSKRCIKNTPIEYRNKDDLRGSKEL